MSLYEEARTLKKVNYTKYINKIQLIERQINLLQKIN